MNFFIMLSLLVLSACTPNIIEYDAEKMEYDQVKNLKAAQKKIDPFNNPSTPSIVKVADEDGVSIEVIKLKSIKSQDGIVLDVWTVSAMNTSKETKCVTIAWKLQDFEFESEQPLEFLISPNETLKVGKMKQSIWSFDGALIAIPPSGYVDNMKVRKADFEKKTSKLTCDMLEEDVKEPKTDTNSIEM